jgi:hypothetical protein
MQGNGRVEFDPNRKEIRWSGINIKEEYLVKWTHFHLRKESDKLVPKLISRAWNELLFPKEYVLEIMREYLNRAETAEGYVKLRWKLAENRAIEFDLLIEDLQTGIWNAQDLRKAMFWSAGRKHS